MTLGFYYNQSACSGCRACQTSCKDRNNLKVGELYRRVATFETGEYPDSVWYHYASTCNHCEDPACVKACPTLSMHKAEDGTVQHDDDLCIGCGSCVFACPYGVPVMRADLKIVGKCDSCKPFRDRGLNPVCVDACNMRALEFGDLDELRAKHGDVVSELPILPSQDLTHPHTIVTPKDAAKNAEYTEVLI